MYRHLHLIYFLILFVLPVTVLSQGEIGEAEKIFIRNESSWGLNLNSNGFGINYRYAKRKDAFHKNMFESEISLVKHPKEIKIYNPQYESQKRFIFGKLNEVVCLKAGIGKQNELFSKSDKGSISIRYFFSAGVSALLLKPIYYEMVDSFKSFTPNVITVYVGIHKFNSSVHNSSDVLGKAPFKLGFNEITVLPGVYVRAGLSFEYSNKDTLVRAIEAGVCFEAFPKRIPLMALENNPQFLINLFVAYRFGSVLDGKKRGSGFKKKFKSKNKRRKVGDKEKNDVNIEEEKNIKEEEYY